MSTKILFTSFGLSLLATLSGCATAPTNPAALCPLTDSKALCLLKLAEISDGISDSKQRPVVQNINHLAQPIKGKSTSAEDVAVATLPFAIGGGGITPGMSSLSSGILLAFAFNSLSGYSGHPNIFVTLPKSRVVDSDPLKTVELEMISAIEKGLGFAIDRQPTRTIINRTFHKNVEREYKMSSVYCGVDSCYLRFRFSRFEDSDRARPKIINQPPTWVANEPVYIFTSVFPEARSVAPDGKEKFIMSDGFYEKIFAHLPSWFYFYIPGNNPGVFNKESSYYLVKP